MIIMGAHFGKLTRTTQPEIDNGLLKDISNLLIIDYSLNPEEEGQEVIKAIVVSANGVTNGNIESIN